MFRRLIVVLITCFCGIPVFADEGREPNVYIVQNIFTPDKRFCLANEITRGIYFFSKTCGEILSKTPSSTVNLVDADGSLYKTLHGVHSNKSLVDAGGFYVFDGRGKKYRPGIETILRPFGNVSAVWYPDLSRQEMVSSEIKLENTDSGKLNVTQPPDWDASGVIAYKGGSPFCMVDDKKGECLILKDYFLGWGNRYSCGWECQSTANLSFYCNPETHYCHKYCKDNQECQLAYSSHCFPDEVRCKSGFDCRFDRKLNRFFCDGDHSWDNSLKVAVGVGTGFAAIAIFIFARALIGFCVKQHNSKAFHNKYANF